jgi:hypothetical protein
MDRNILLEKVDLLIGELSGSVPESESLHGWTEESRSALLCSFSDLRSRLARDELSKLDRHLNHPRGMDSWGISGGRWFSLGAEITNELHDYVKWH